VKPRFQIGEKVCISWEAPEGSFYLMTIAQILYAETGIKYEAVHEDGSVEQVDESELMTVDETIFKALNYIKFTINELERLKKEAMK